METRYLPHGLEEGDLPLLLELPLFSGMTRGELLELVSDAWVAASP